jgi:uncharacterized pyridoxamine 5'-phosphate oxidase family protein
MKELVDFLIANPVQFLATVGLDGKPKVRPFQFMLVDGGKLWFCTGNKKDVYAELQKQPYIELSVSSSGNAWLRISARVIFENNIAIKHMIIEQNELVRSIYISGDNPDFEVFYLTDGSATISLMSRHPPRRLTT